MLRFSKSRSSKGRGHATVERFKANQLVALAEVGDQIKKTVSDGVKGCRRGKAKTKPVWRQGAQGPQVGEKSDPQDSMGSDVINSVDGRAGLEFQRNSLRKPEAARRQSRAA
eukprot:Opistho-1_new@27371